MPWHNGGNKPWVGLGLALLVITAAGCRSTPAPPPQASTPITHGGAPGTTASGPVEETIGGFTATVIDPPRMTTLATQQNGSQINLRSQPTTLSPILGTGQGGDAVRLLRLAEGEEGFSWYYVQYTQSDQEGWVRGDFVDVAGATAATPAAVASAQPVVAKAPQPCGGDRQEAFFETQSFSVYFCKNQQGLRYIGTNKATQESLDTTDVSTNQGVYIVIDGNFQYHVSDTTLAVYQVNNGSYSELKREPVLRFERFIY